MSISGITKDKTRGFSIDDLGKNRVGTFESMLAGVASGLIDIPKGAFTLGAALMDMGFGTNNAANLSLLIHVWWINIKHPLMLKAD